MTSRTKFAAGGSTILVEWQSISGHLLAVELTRQHKS
jgi:hypothetical protein